MGLWTRLLYKLADKALGIMIVDEDYENGGGEMDDFEKIMKGNLDEETLDRMTQYEESLDSYSKRFKEARFLNQIGSPDFPGIAKCLDLHDKPWGSATMGDYGATAFLDAWGDICAMYIFNENGHLFVSIWVNGQFVIMPLEMFNFATNRMSLEAGGHLKDETRADWAFSIEDLRNGLEDA